MIPNRVIFLILLTLCALTASAQEHLSFRPDTWDFGTIRETDGRVSHTFTGVNRGDSPLVILDVVTTCGCTVPDFSKKPILPGEKTQITVTYDPANRPGSFTKELWVYSSEKRKIATLTVQGSVIPRQKTVEELYPVDAGGGLRLASTLNAFSYIYPGRQVQAAIGYANTSKRPVRLELRPETTSGALRTNYPKQIAPGERGEINFTYLIPADKPRYGAVRDALEDSNKSFQLSALYCWSPTASASTRSPRMQHKTPRKPIFRKISLNLDRSNMRDQSGKSTLRFRTRAARS